MKMRFAFYKGRGNWSDWLIRFATRSKYSHVELVLETGQCFSSSLRDGGVRVKVIEFYEENWDFVEVSPPLLMTHVYQIFQKTIGKPYDLKGVLFSQGIHLRIQDNDKWFCSELMAYLLNLDEPFNYSPGRLFKKIGGSS